MTAIFVDASAFYALADTGDQAHAAAVQAQRRLGGAELVTTDLVLAEAWFLARARRGRVAAMRLWQAIRDGAVRVEPLPPADLERAWAIATELADQDFSFTDCTSFAFIERQRLRQAFSFDRDFAVFRYGPHRDVALEVLGLSTG